MCGICGFNWEDKRLLKQMMDSLQHRGPDAFGHYVDKSVSLGHRRLSIIDLSPKGKQPLSNEEGNIWITFNGEIYNFALLRSMLEKKGHIFRSETDTEVIVHAYEEWGFQCVKHFQGMFAFVIYDAPKKLLFLARDRLGIKPLFYFFGSTRTKQGGIVRQANTASYPRALIKHPFIFASEIKAILQHPIHRSLNLTAMESFLASRYVGTPETIFQGIYRLPEAHYGVFNLNTGIFTLTQYWDVKEQIIPKTQALAQKEVLALLRDTVKQHLIADVPLGAYLSGGIDSSAIVALMSEIAKEQKNEVNTFSVDFGYGENVNEKHHAQHVAEQFQTHHRHFTIEPSIYKILPQLVRQVDEPFADVAAIPLYELSRRAKKHVTVVLTGDGGDEVFAGYDHYRFLLARQRMQRFPSLLRKKIIPVALRSIPFFFLNKVYKHSTQMGPQLFNRFQRLMETDSKSQAHEELLGIFDQSEREQLLKEGPSTNSSLSSITPAAPALEPYHTFDQRYFSTKWHYLNQLLYYDTKNLLVNGFLVKTDRMTMASGIEARVPFLDHRVVEYGFSLAPSLKINNGTTKFILKKALLPVLPRHILYRKKQPFHVPIEHWIEHELMGYCTSVLDKKRITKEGLFKYTAIEAMIRNYSKAKLFYGRQIWSLVNFELWYEQYFGESRKE
ncbi:asparagine synthase (glutamine-hydrolyzing) [Candidatus Woesearchaeota archaeon]|nr:asparagine synthase (glutamine-hydrolyzing) [Candidatus Woesearchaeota archaeon]